MWPRTVWENGSYARQEEAFHRAMWLGIFAIVGNLLIKNQIIMETLVHIIEKRSFVRKGLTGGMGYAYGFIKPDGKVGSFTSENGDHDVFPAMSYDGSKAITVKLAPSVFGDKMSLKEVE